MKDAENRMDTAWIRGGMNLSESITREDIEKYQSHRLAAFSERRKKTVSPATVNREIAMVRHLFTKAVEWGLIDGNPARGININRTRPPATPSSSTTVRRWGSVRGGWFSGWRLPGVESRLGPSDDSFSSQAYVASRRAESTLQRHPALCVLISGYHSHQGAKSN